MVTQKSQEEQQALIDKLMAENAAYKAQNEALQTENEVGVKPVIGKWKSKLKVAGTMTEKTYSFALGAPIFFRDAMGKTIHAETIIKMAAGETVTAESFKPIILKALEEKAIHIAVPLEAFSHELVSITQESAQKMLDKLVEVGYQYLVSE